MYTPTEEDFIRDENGLSPLAIRYMKAKSINDCLDLPHNHRTVEEFVAARKFLTSCPLEVIPLHITCFSYTMDYIIEKRLKEG